MINANAAKKINNSIVANMGLIGSTIQMARSNESDEKAVVERIQAEQRAITSLLVSVVDYLSRLDQSLKTQSNIARLVYNQQVLSQREQAVETRSTTREQPDAVPVAANDNEEGKTGSALGALASGLLIGATTLLFANYEAIMDKLKSAASMLGLGAAVAAQQDAVPPSTTEDLTSPAATDLAPPAPSTGSPSPVRQPQQAQAQQQPARSQPSSSRPATSSPVPQSTGGSNSVPIQANRVAASRPVSSAPVATTPASNANPTPNNTAAVPIAAGAGMSYVQSASGQTAKVNSKHAEQFQGFINDLEATGYKIKTLGGFADRNIAGTNKPSYHAQGMAIDVNYKANPHTFPGDSNYGQTNMPANVGDLAKKHGLGWGGNWRSSKDTMHFSAAASEQGTAPDPRDNGGIIGSEGVIARSLESVQESLSGALERFKPTNMMTRKIEREALQREKDLMAKPRSTGSEQGQFSKPQGARIPSPVQQSVAATGVDVTSQYMFMFFGEKPQSATVGNLTQSR